MAALSYGAMNSVSGPGLEALALPECAASDETLEPAGFLVGVDDAVRIHFLDWDASRAAAGPAAARPRRAPAVLLVPGLAQTAWTWAPVARRLARRSRVAAMDLRGHGLSDAPTAGYDPDHLAGDAIAVAEGAGLLAPPGEIPVGPFVVAGLGFGAVVAAWTANALGERCAGLVLVDGGWEDVGATTDATADEWLAAIEEPPEVLASMAAWLADREDFDPASWDADQERAARAQVVETAAGRVKIAVHPHALRASVGGDLVVRARRGAAARGCPDRRARGPRRRRVAGRGAARGGPPAGRGRTIGDPRRVVPGAGPQPGSLRAGRRGLGGAGVGGSRAVVLSRASWESVPPRRPTARSVARA